MPSLFFAFYFSILFLHPYLSLFLLFSLSISLLLSLGWWIWWWGWYAAQLIILLRAHGFRWYATSPLIFERQRFGICNFSKLPVFNLFFIASIIEINLCYYSAKRVSHNIIPKNIILQKLHFWYDKILKEYSYILLNTILCNIVGIFCYLY